MQRNKSLEELLEKNKSYRLLRIAIIVLAIFVVIWSFFMKGRESDKPAEEMSFASIEIRCDQVAENMELLKDESLKEYIPENGVIVSAIDYQIVPNKTTVFDITDQVCKDNDVQIEYEYTPGYGGYYIKGINYLYEFSAGQNSGWLYKIDGENPSYSPDKLKLQGGEKIVWYYTTDYVKEDN